MNKKIVHNLLIATVISMSSLNVFAAPVPSENAIIKGSTVLPGIEVNSTQDKINFCNEREIAINKKMNQTPRSGTVMDRISDTDYSMHNGEDLYSQFSSTLSLSGFDSYVNGASKAVWLGENPMYCDKILLTDRYTTTGISLGSVGGADGGNWNISGGISKKIATWISDPETNKAWRVEHDTSDLNFTGFDLTIKQESIGDFKFGSKYYTTTAVDTGYL